MTGAHARDESFCLDQPEVQRAPAPRRKRKPDPAVYISVVALVVLVASLAHVAQRAKLAALAYDLHNATRQLEDLKRTQTQLRVEVEEARSLSRIEASARSRLGMVQPSSTAWIVLDPPADESVQLAQSTGERGWKLGEALSEWYNRVRSQVRAALPLHLRELDR